MLRAVPPLIGVPTYTIAEAAHYLQIPTITLRGWVRGYRGPPKGDLSESRQPIIVSPDHERFHLSFANLVEAHVLDAIRREHGALQKMRATITSLRNRTGVEHPLAFQSMTTDGVSLLVHLCAESSNLSSDRQLALSVILNVYLRRIDWNESGFAIRLYPFMRKRELNAPKVVVMDPEVSFGKPVLVGTGIPTAAVAERYKAGESIDELAKDYDLKRTLIEDAIRCELTAA